MQGGRLILTSNSAQNAVLADGRGGGDVQGGRLVFDYNTAGVTDQVATIKGILAAGFAQPTKFSSGKIRSSTATSKIGLGYFDDTTAKQLSVAYAYYGDANLDGTVNALDFNAVATGFGKSGSVWSSGDFNYDGVVNTSGLHGDGG